ncbi:MAG TPA: tyrosine-protein phosphatase [Ramlibacter sp.]|uniref:tyrosine-protein phosphatase n=1 Tax=Ramlibacter sp. TaxID=1917967 RepID=UPI002CB3D248|nr:tyrosine-protein phosphatase [Ramlibacter sp.]HVZ45892.1 tyrosine-protein phosphatase [Ramlibacter sp.]
MQLTGSPNFRLLPRVRPHTLFRSDHLGALDEDDARQVRALGITRVLDFRGVNEREEAVCRLPGVTVHSLAIEPTVVQKIDEALEQGLTLSGDDVVELMRDTYRGFVRTSSDRFAQFFAYLLASNEPTVFHCTAGKDRTGFAAALVLYALGASHEEVMRDYLLTNELVRPRTPAAGRLAPEIRDVLFRVQPEFLLAAFEAIEEDHGTLDAYLRDALALGERERRRLAELYL